MVRLVNELKERQSNWHEVEYAAVEAVREISIKADGYTGELMHGQP